jgi:arabinose-5-phosphate isomerase
MNTTTQSTILGELLEKERGYLNDFFDQIDQKNLEDVLKYLFECQGLIVITGVGKSGLIAKKMAVTMTSTGTRALFLSPTNALHGDLGILKPEDIFIAFSKSGESDELLNLIPYVRNRGVKTIAICTNAKSRIAKAVDLPLCLPDIKELCPFDMAPTTSTTVQTIVGDVLSIALMRMKGFTEENFAEYHPAGRLGKRLTLKVSDLMLRGEAAPLCKTTSILEETLEELTNKQCGCVMVITNSFELLGIFTDGDLRRALQKFGSKALKMTMGELMVKTARSIRPEVLAYDAMKFMESDQKKPIMVLPVIDHENKVVGIIKMHDLIQSGL